MKTNLLVIVSAVLIALLLMTADIPALEAAQQLFMSSLGSARALSGTLRSATPLLVAGIAVYFALRAGLFNIGVEGQLILGAMASTVIALRVPGPLGIVLAILGGMLAGALWALPAGYIKAYRGGHEVITTIMLNNIAIHLTTALVGGILKDPTQEGPTTAFLASSSRLPAAVSLDSGAFVLSLALVLGVLLLVGFTLWLNKTVSGYELNAVGANPTAAEFAGVPVKRTILRSMFVSGAIAGLAGAFQVLAYEGRFFEGFSPGYGFDALGVALLAGQTSWAILPGALLFGVLDKGSSAIQLFGVPRGFSEIVLGLLIITFAAYRYRRKRVNA